MARLFSPPSNHSVYAQGYVTDEATAAFSNPNAWSLDRDKVLDLDSRLGLADMADRARQWASFNGCVAVQLRKKLPGGGDRPIGCIMGVR